MKKIILLIALLVSFNIAFAHTEGGFHVTVYLDKESVKPASGVALRQLTLDRRLVGYCITDSDGICRFERTPVEDFYFVGLKNRKLYGGLHKGKNAGKVTFRYDSNLKKVLEYLDGGQIEEVSEVFLFSAR